MTAETGTPRGEAYPTPAITAAGRRSGRTTDASDSPPKAETAVLAVDLVAINYAPEVTGIAPYVTDMARALAHRGWDVRVLTGYPHYPQWRLLGAPSDYPALSCSHGVTVQRLRHSIPATTSLLQRARMEAGFGWRVLRSGTRAGAVVVVVSPPLIAAALLVARRLLRRQSGPLGVWVQDLYSQAVTEAAEKSGASAGLVRLLERFALRRADQVAVVHRRFASVVTTKLGVPAAAVSVVPNWNQARPEPRIPRAQARAALGIPADQVIALHAGNMGAKQGLDTLVAAARLLDEQGSNTRIYLVGDGNQRSELQRQARGVTRIVFVDPLPAAAFHRLLSAADVLVVSEKPGVREMSIPSKLTTYFSFGLPVVAAVDARGITADEVRRSGAGVVVPAGDPAALLAAVDDLVAAPDTAARLGAAGLDYCQRALGADVAAERFAAWLGKLADTKEVSR